MFVQSDRRRTGAARVQSEDRRRPQRAGYGRARRLAGVGVLFAFLGPWVAPRSTAADSATPPCDAWEIEYALSGRLALSDTPMNQADGVYPVGPGTLVLRMDDREGKAGGRVKMLSYEMRQNFTVVSKALFFTTTVVTNTTTRAAPDACGVAAEGILSGGTLLWDGPVHRVRSDGTLSCDGSLCGKFGAPPPGPSALHIGPSEILFQPFQFGAGLQTFTMARTFVSRTENPRQTAHLAIAGRETRRACVQVKPCP